MTQYLQTDPQHLEVDLIQSLTAGISCGNIAIIPTETVYGLVGDERVVGVEQKLFSLKGRPEIKPIPRLARDIKSIIDHGACFSPQALCIAEAFWPGPLTMVLPHHRQESLAYRIPDHPFAQALLEKMEFPLLATSANFSGASSSVNAEEAREHFDGKVDWIIDSGPSIYKKGSTIIKWNGPQFNLLRQGSIKPEQIQQVLQLHQNA